VKLYFTSGEAARICAVHINTIKGWVRKGEIDATHSPGGRWRIKGESLLRFLQRNDMLVPDELRESPCKILVIDDDPAVCELVRGAMKLSASPCEITGSEDGYSGLIQIGEIKPDLLVLDIMMPGINGLEVLHRLRANPELASGMRILVLTGAKDSKLVVRNIKGAQPDAVLFKPVSVILLLETIQALLQSGNSLQPSIRK